MRIGILALLHESNTFIAQPTTVERFREDIFLEGEPILAKFSGAHHELGGFLFGLQVSSPGRSSTITPVPLAVFRATPSGPICDAALHQMLDRMLFALDRQERLDGLLIAAHGAAVAQSHLDADGYWLSEIRRRVGETMPIIATLDAHANLSKRMVSSCNALIGYRTNPHLDQRQRGEEAARLMLATLRNEVRPTMSAVFPPLVINIERQGTTEPHLRPLYELADQQLSLPGVLSNSILLGFPYSDVPELGAAAIVVCNDNLEQSCRLADQLSDWMWRHRDTLRGDLIDVPAVLDLCLREPADRRICLLDMGDNVGGGSAADGTILAAELYRRRIGPAFVCICDPVAVAACNAVSPGTALRLRVGGRVDRQHGPPLELSLVVVSKHAGDFRESRPRHGGITDFDQGQTVIVRAVDAPLTIMLTCRRMVPFSLNQLTACGLEPRNFRILVAKGVHAPLAAYREVCDCFYRVNTPGSTDADLEHLQYQHRRRPLFPFESSVPRPLAGECNAD